MGVATGAASLLSGCGARGIIPNVVIFIQENRSFDHYFGSYRGVRGFSDVSAAFQQPYPANTANAPAGVLLPFHMDTTTTNSACTLVQVVADSICLHSDTPGAVALARRVRAALAEAGVGLGPFA